MKKDGQELTVHCFFTEEGEDLQESIFRSLQFFIEKNILNRAVLDAMGKNSTINLMNGRLSQEA